ncbi:MAG: hypothetical protein ACE5IR_05750 [bacterium]
MIKQRINNFEKPLNIDDYPKNESTFFNTTFKAKAVPAKNAGKLNWHYHLKYQQVRKLIAAE